MNAVERINKLQELRFLSKAESTMDDFVVTYEETLTSAKGDTEMLSAMQKILLEQAGYLMNLWLQEKAKEKIQ